MHNTIKQELHRIAANIQRKQFVNKDTHFSSMVEAEEKRLMEISSAFTCLIQTEFKSSDKIYQVPISHLDSDASELVPAAMSIDIRVGDLAFQSVDMVVVCSTSHNLLNDILDKAGSEVKNEVNAVLSSNKITSKGYETNGGKLLCQRLFFLPWVTRRLDDTALLQTIQQFFTTAIEQAVNTKKTSIAFPALGCGELNYDPQKIAEIILEQTQRYASYNLKILIVLLPSKGEAYGAFCLKLAELRQKTSTTNQTEFHFSHKCQYSIIFIK